MYIYIYRALCTANYVYIYIELSLFGKLCVYIYRALSVPGTMCIYVDLALSVQETVVDDPVLGKVYDERSVDSSCRYEKNTNTMEDGSTNTMFNDYENVSIAVE